MTNTADLVTKLKSERLEAKLGQHLYAIPRHDTSIIREQVIYYHTASRVRTHVDFTKEFCIELNHVHYKEISAKQYKDLQESEHTLEYLFSNDLVYPFLVFVNGYMIRWEYIKLIAVTEKYYLLIQGMDPTDFAEVNHEDGDNYFDIINLPDGITYRQDDSSVNDKTLFAFDSIGKYVSTGTAKVVIDKDDAGITRQDLTITTDPICVISDQIQYAYFRENVFIFDNLMYDGDNKVTIIGSIAKINDGVIPEGHSFHMVTFFNSGMATPSYSNISRVDFNGIKDDIIAYLNGTRYDRYIDVLKEPFNTEMLFSKSYNTNLAEYLSYIANYNQLFFNEIFDDTKSFSSIEVDYKWVMAHRDIDGNFRIPRRFNYATDHYLIMFVNGELYKHYKSHKYDFGDFVVPIADIKEGDKIEIWYFKNAKNHTLPMNISSLEPYLPLDVDYYYIKDDMRIFSSYATESPFTYDAGGQQTFPVEYTLEEQADGKLRVRFTDARYYNRDLVMAGANRFVYMLHSVELEDGMEQADYFKFDLSDNFKYCNEYDRYIVFINGRRLMNDHYRLVLPCNPDTPFSKFQIYMAVPLHNKDRVEIFYLPHRFDDVYNATKDLNTTGMISIVKDKLPLRLDKELYTFWLNGKKVPKSDIVNIDSTRVQLITDQKSLKTLRVSIMLSNSDALEQVTKLFRENTDKWDTAVKLHGNPYTLLGINPPVFTNVEEDFFRESVHTATIMREVVRDWYISNINVDSTAPFLFAYPDQSIVVGTDSKGMKLLDAMDNTTTDNFDVERPEY